MHATSADPGTCAALQLAAVSQLPLAAVFHESVHAGGVAEAGVDDTTALPMRAPPPAAMPLRASAPTERTRHGRRQACCMSFSSPCRPSRRTDRHLIRVGT